jgi:deazaflavin-dependent oxidoreductase (nitroreductase family)
MNTIVRSFNRALGARMAASGRFAMIETIGRKTGRHHATPVGFAELELAPAGQRRLVVGAGSPDADWARNLLATPVCRVRIGSETRTCLARSLQGDERTRAVARIRHRYGPGMADRIGLGPVFALHPIVDRGGGASIH